MDTSADKPRKKTYSGNFCQVPHCSNQSGRDKLLNTSRKYHRIPGKGPKTAARRKAWLKAIPREKWSPKKNDRICSDHFVGGMACDLVGSPSYVPTIFKGAEKAKGKDSPKKRRSQTSNNASFKENQQVLPHALHMMPVKSRKRKIPAESPHPRSKSGRPPTVTTDVRDGCNQGPSEDHDYVRTTRLHYVQSEVEHFRTMLEEEREQFKLQLEEMKGKTLSLDTVKNFKMWTNFPNRDVFNSLSAYLKTRGAEELRYWHGGVEHRYFKDTGLKNKPGPSRKLSFDEELFMVVVKLKSGLNNTELSHLFGISDTVIGHIFTTLINFLAIELKTLFEMPPLHEEGIAECLKKWENLMVVLDCTELPVEKSTSLKARKQLFSNYKGRDTIKFAVSLGRNLCVNYVSKAYGGRASDQFITYDSEDMIKALPRGSKVMTDRGFNVGEYLKDLGVELIIPSFKGRGRTQMTEKELKSSENIAMARIHVERIIQRIRTYQILEKKTVKLSTKDIIEQTFSVCAYLTNFQLPIIR